MGTRTAYTPGTFSWTDLSSPDLAGSKAFYGGLFGWESTDVPVGDDGVYSMQAIGGQIVCAIAPQQAEQQAAGVPPMWNSYVTVEDCDASAAKAAELGGNVHMPGFDVMEAGRMAVIQDPQGAFFMLWQAKETLGAALVNAEGALSWNELATTDIAAASSFYAGLFGWEMTPMEGMGMEYSTIANAGHGNGGIRAVMPPEVPPHWLVYFGTDDIDASVAKVGELGGTLLAPVMDIGVGKIAAVQDPQGAVFALYAGDFED